MSIKIAIEKVNEQKRPAFIPYIMAGDGGLATLPGTIRRLEQLGATAIEVGIPFTDPVADGPIIEEAGMRALQNGATLKTIISVLKEHQDQFTIPLIFMSYLNPVLAYGEHFAKDAYEVGVRGVIIPDMPLEEKDIIHASLTENHIDLIQLVSLTSNEERIQKLAAASEGFIYAVTVNGVTGERAAFANSLPEHFNKLKQIANVPVLAGFGISNAQHVKQFSAFSDGVIVGSAIVKAIHENQWNVIEDIMSPLQVTN